MVKTAEDINLELVMENSRLLNRVIDLINEVTDLKEQLELAKEEDEV